VFLSELQHSIAEVGAPLCVGLDPHPDLLGAGRPWPFVRCILDATARYACAYKPNSAFYEAAGRAGWRTLRRTIDHAHALDRPVVLDAKRCDIASTAAAYATAAFDTLKADAVTVVPYMGEDAVRPFLDAGGFVFLLAVPTNPSAAAMIESGNPPLYERVVDMALDLSRRYPDQIGLVVGATRRETAERVATLAPELPWLVPGVGAQGGTTDLARAGIGVRLVSASRSVLGDSDPAAAAARLNAHLREILR